MYCKSFLKWVGGKKQLIPEISNLINQIITHHHNFTYIESFVGGVAVLFHLLNSVTQVNYCVINDLNHNLINADKIIQSHPQELIKILPAKYY